MARGDVMVTPVVAQLNYTGAGVNYLVQANNGGLYLVYVDGASDLVWRKSTDGGFSWSAPVVILAGTVVAHSVFYGRWAGVADDLIYMAYTDANAIKFRALDTASADALGSETTVFTGVSSATGGALTIWRSRGTTTLRVAGSIDAGAEDGAWSSTDSGATWGDTIADPSEAATQDQYFGLPGWNADANDEMLIFVDASANGISVKRYDDSANTWTEAAIIADASFLDQTAANAFPHVACFVDTANSRNVVACWNAVDAANQDLRVFIITDTTVTETTANAVLNGTDDQGLVAFSLATDTSTWYVFYTGNADGTETYSTATNVYYKTSTDDGANWSAQTLLTNRAHGIQWLAGVPRFTGNFIVAFHDDVPNTTQDAIKVNVLIPSSSGGITAPIFGGGILR